ncbi:MAG: Holliday junction resolvase RecU [Clostridiales bacterium]|nr:Holliday junction resolvase RecU [Clostridiales bacterium]
MREGDNITFAMKPGGTRQKGKILWKDPEGESCIVAVRQGDRELRILLHTSGETATGELLTEQAADREPDLQHQREEAAKRSYRAAKNNAQGHYFEQAIQRGCKFYREKGLAEIDKTPEGFRVLKKKGNGLFEGRFIGKAQVDFQGTVRLWGQGVSILFDAKCTGKDRIEQSALTETQAEEPERHWKLGAVCGVAVGLGGNAYFVPWDVWRDMKAICGHKYMNQTELGPFQVKYTGSTVYFLSNLAEEGQKT